MNSLIALENPYDLLEEAKPDLTFSRDNIITKEESDRFLFLGCTVGILGTIILIGSIYLITQKYVILKSIIPFILPMSVIFGFVFKSFFILEPYRVALVVKKKKIKVISESGLHWRSPLEKIIPVQLGLNELDVNLTPLTNQSEHAINDVLNITGELVNPIKYYYRAITTEESLKGQARHALRSFRNRINSLEEGEDREQVVRNFEIDLLERFGGLGFEVHEYGGRIEDYPFNRRFKKL